MQINNILEILLAISGLAGIAYRVGLIEAKLYKELDKVTDELNSRIQLLDKTQSILISRSDDRYENIQVTIHQIDEKINHKFQRLHNGQKQVQDYLQKNHEFIIRGEEY